MASKAAVIANLVSENAELKDELAKYKQEVERLRIAAKDAIDLLPSFSAESGDTMRAKLNLMQRLREAMKEVK